MLTWLPGAVQEADGAGTGKRAESYSTQGRESRPTHESYKEIIVPSQEEFSSAVIEEIGYLWKC